MVQFIESELVLLKKEIDEMWTLVYNQLGRAGEAVLTLTASWHSRYWCANVVSMPSNSR